MLAREERSGGMIVLFAGAPLVQHLAGAHPVRLLPYHALALIPPGKNVTLQKRLLTTTSAPESAATLGKATMGQQETGPSWMYPLEPVEWRWKVSAVRTRK